MEIRPTACLIRKKKSGGTEVKLLIYLARLMQEPLRARALVTVLTIKFAKKCEFLNKMERLIITFRNRY